MDERQRLAAGMSRPAAMESAGGRWWWVRRDRLGRIVAMAADLESVQNLDVAVVVRRRTIEDRR